mmetsp:Transcript_22607/g.46201  ORF Transcript_22607/g.46201 Transcript_22607/m.46201 type:complete len:185 (-) Transcript_22607:119-673(-)
MSKSIDLHDWNSNSKMKINVHYIEQAAEHNNATVRDTLKLFFELAWTWSPPTKEVQNVSIQSIKRGWSQLVKKVKVFEVKKEDDPLLCYSIKTCKTSYCQNDEMVPSQVRQTRFSVEKHSCLFLSVDSIEESDSDDIGSEFFDDLDFDEMLNVFDAAAEILENTPETRSMTYGQLRDTLRSLVE